MDDIRRFTISPVWFYVKEKKSREKLSHFEYWSEQMLLSSTSNE